METRNLLMAFILALAVTIGFHYLGPQPRLAAHSASSDMNSPLSRLAPGNPAAPAAPASPAAAEHGLPGLAATPSGTFSTGASLESRAAALARSPRVTIDSPRLKGSIALTGGRLDDVILTDYHETIDRKSPAIQLLNPPGTSTQYYQSTGWTAAETTLELPGPDTLWQADQTILTASQPVTLHWTNAHGLQFSRQFKIDQNFMIAIEDRVVNTSAAPITLYPYSFILRFGKPKTDRSIVLHEGFVSVLAGVEKDENYKDPQPGAPISFDSTGGWLGLTDKYWLVALIPPQTEPIAASFSMTPGRDLENKTDATYQVTYRGAAHQVAAGETIAVASRVFAGAKEVRVLRDYEAHADVPKFDQAVDWGWFFFLTRPIFWLLDTIYNGVGNFGIAILLLTVTIKLLFVPLAHRSYVSMGKMKKLGPMMTGLREKYKDDRARLSQETMALYKREKVNPLSGCLPIILQIPVFFSLYKVLYVTIEMRHAPFFGWINDLSAPDPTTVFNLFGLIPWVPPASLMFGIWPLIMGATMFLQQRLQPQPPDPMQARVMMFLPLIFMVTMARFPAGLVIYWAWNNTLSIIQQYLIMRQQGVKIGQR